MEWIFSFIEAIISSYTLLEMGEIKQRKTFMCVVTALTTVLLVVLQPYHLTFRNLFFSCSILWYTCMILFKRNNYLYNLFVVIFAVMIIYMGMTLPAVFLFNISKKISAIGAFILQAIFSYLFIRYRRRYNYLTTEYWVPLLTIMICCMIGVQHEMELLLDNMNLESMFVLFVIFIANFVALSFFRLIEKSNKEKEMITKQLEELKYKELTDRYIKRSYEELGQLKHRMGYEVWVIKHALEQHNYSEAYNHINDYLDSLGKTKRPIYTHNFLFDMTLTSLINRIDCKINLSITISRDDFYNQDFIVDILVGVIDLIKKEKQITLIINDDDNYCYIDIVSTESIKKLNDMTQLLDQYSQKNVYYKINRTDIDHVRIKIKKQIEDNI